MVHGGVGPFPGAVRHSWTVKSMLFARSGIQLCWVSPGRGMGKVILQHAAVGVEQCVAAIGLAQDQP